MPIIKKMTDAHVHFREGLVAEHVIPYSAQRCSHVIVMPNTEEPITVENFNSFKSTYQRIAGEQCKVHLTCKLLPTTTYKEVEQAAKLGAIGYKLYVAGATTNSNDGIPEESLYHWSPEFTDVVKAIHDNNLALLHHGETCSDMVLSRARFYKTVFETFLENFPKLRMSWEHITDYTIIDRVHTLFKQGYNVFGTVTLHHLQNTLTDLIGNKLRPDLYCKPSYRFTYDKNYLNSAIKLDCFGFGSDSAPHPILRKYCAECCPGVFTAPVMLEALYEHFITRELLDYWDDFTYQRANKFYNIPNDNEDIEIVQENWKIRRDDDDEEVIFTPYKFGETLSWKLKSSQ